MSVKFTAPTCPICSQSSDPCFQAGEHRMYRCKSCQTAFVHPIPTEEYLTSFYSSFHLNCESGGIYEEFESRASADFATKIAMIQSAGWEPEFRVLDVGCGRGFFVKACVNAGINATGVDLSDSAIEYAVEELKVEAYQGRLVDLVNTLGEFDVVTLWATIEHVPDPLELLRDIYKSLKPGGRFFLDTGIGCDWLDKLLPGMNQWYDPPQHLFVFSEEGIQKIVRAAGFEVISINRCFERSTLRLAIRNVRGLGLSLGLRIIAALGRMHANEFCFTRFPLGNLMSLMARKPR